MQLDDYTLQGYCIEAVKLQRRALNASRWAYLNEQGAFQIREAANDLQRASALLGAVSLAVLRRTGRYGHLPRPVLPLRVA